MQLSRKFKEIYRYLTILKRIKTNQYCESVNVMGLRDRSYFYTIFHINTKIIFRNLVYKRKESNWVLSTWKKKDHNYLSHLKNI
jgi:hypothetical protein